MKAKYDKKFIVNENNKIKESKKKEKFTISIEVPVTMIITRYVKSGKISDTHSGYEFKMHPLDVDSLIQKQLSKKAKEYIDGKK